MDLEHSSIFEPDETLKKLREQRLAQLKREILSENDHYGSLTPVTHEKEVIHMITKTARLVIHFRMPSFRRCSIMSDHLSKLANLHPKTSFIEVNADEMTFLTSKFNVQVLPCLVVIILGQLVDKIIGFDELGGTDDFPTSTLEERLKISGAVSISKKPSRHNDSESDDE